MADSLLEIKRKISSTKKTGQITSAMQMVSGVKLSQSERLRTGYLEYFGKIRSTINHLMSTIVNKELSNKARKTTEYADLDLDNIFDSDTINNLIAKRDVKKTGYLVVTGDRGLVGSYNSTVIKTMMSLFEQSQEQDHECEVIAIGGVGADFFKKQGMNVVYEYRGISDVPNFDEVRDIVATAVNMYVNGVYDELYVCYTHHVNTISSEFRAEKILPISEIEINEKVDDTEYIVEPSNEVVLDYILPQFAQGMIFGAILDAKTAEHASSMTAMQNATKNADSLISDLTTQLNRARQAQITTEITEIVGGAAALE